MRIVKQVRATFGDALWADFVTHANARYIDAILRPFRRPIIRRPDRLKREPSTLPHSLRSSASVQV